ncbi:UNVERIFIED_CONTAM: hypothetical protein GTU68_035285, partial [Idotea baltica]|nr:hypothetical protein [Idotea baltica]
KPEPLADPKLANKICELLQQLISLKQVRKGVNEILKEMTKSSVEVVILAADCDPLEVIMTLPPLCEEKNVQYCFVPSKAVLGRACGIKTQVAAAAIIYKEGSQLNAQIIELKDKIEQLFI